MLKFLSALALTVLLSYTAFLFSDVVPWWGFAIGAFLAGATVPQKAWLCWVSGFLGVMVCWGFLCWHINELNGGLMARKMAEILPLHGSANMLIIITAGLGALVGGMAALAGAYMRKKPTLSI